MIKTPKPRTQARNPAHLNAMPDLEDHGQYKWSYKSPNLGYKYTYLTYDPTYNYA